MDKETIVKKLKETEEKIKQIETTFHQLLGRKVTLEELLEDINKEPKASKETKEIKEPNEEKK